MQSSTTIGPEVWTGSATAPSPTWWPPPWPGRRWRPPIRSCSTPRSSCWPVLPSLPLVEPSSRPVARQRMVWLGATYQAAGEEVPSFAAGGGGVPGHLDGDDPRALMSRLGAAIAAGELDDADRAAAVLAATRSPAQLSHDLTDAVLPRLSAAAHGNIALYQLPRIAPRSRVAASSVRGIVRELARYPEWVLTWPAQRSPEASNRGGAAPGLVDVLLGPASPGDPGSTFIFPTMSIVESSGLAMELLDLPTRDSDVGRAGRDLLRVAAWSMLQDTPDHAPYGWTHCLTLPQAAARVGRRRLEPITGPRHRRHLCPGLPRHPRPGRARSALGPSTPRPRRCPRRAGGVTGRGGGSGVARRPRHPRRGDRPAGHVGGDPPRCSPGQVHAGLLRRRPR